VGPESVGYRLTQDARVFGGQVLTATDIAVAASLCDLADRSMVNDITNDLKMGTLDTIKKMIEDAIDQVKVSFLTVVVIIINCSQEIQYMYFVLSDKQGRPTCCSCRGRYHTG
jgi:hypothetical protein